MNYRIYPPDEILQTDVTLPLSKSVSARQLIINALSPHPTTLKQVADCSDTNVMQRALTNEGDTIDAADAGTAMRFLTAYFACQEGRNVTLTGTERMQQRPIRPLVEALRACGADIQYIGEEGFPPMQIKGKKLTGGDVAIDATISSQFISALLMIAPKMTNGLRLTLDGEPSSLPYIDLTIKLMQQCGADVERTDNVITVAAGDYSGVADEGEADWSAATFWWELEAVSMGFITLRGLKPDSAQPDRRTPKLFEPLGVVTEWEGEDGGIDLMGSPDVASRLTADLTDTPDAAPALAVACALVGVAFHLTGLQNLAIKESNRLQALATELLKLGLVCQTTDDTLTWDGVRYPVAEVPTFDTYADHRMAMALAPVAMFIPGTTIKDVEVVKKSYPQYWQHLADAGFQLIDADQPTEE